MLIKKNMYSIMGRWIPFNHFWFVQSYFIYLDRITLVCDVRKVRQRKFTRSRQKWIENVNDYVFVLLIITYYMKLKASGNQWRFEHTSLVKRSLIFQHTYLHRPQKLARTRGQSPQAGRTSVGRQRIKYF